MTPGDDLVLIFRWLPSSADVLSDNRNEWSYLAPSRRGESLRQVERFFGCVASLMSHQLRLLTLQSLRHLTEVFLFYKVSNWICFQPKRSCTQIGFNNFNYLKYNLNYKTARRKFLCKKLGFVKLMHRKCLIIYCHLRIRQLSIFMTFFLINTTRLEFFNSQIF
jgi:hypothetical protein